MNWALWLVLGAAAAVLILSAALAGASPRFWYGMGRIVIEEGFPKLSAAWTVYKARHTPEEWRAIREKWDRIGNPHRYN